MQTYESITWIVARAGGFTAYGLLAGAVIIGLALSLRWQSARWPRLINTELHNHLTLLSVVFLCVHVAAVWIDPFTNFTTLAVFVPFVTTYRTLWMSLGIVAFYLGLAIGLTTLVRTWIGYTLWRRLHTLTLAIFALATAHGIFTGTDTKDWWALGIYATCTAIVGLLFVLRLMHSAAEAQQRQAKRQMMQSRPQPGA